MKTRSISVRSLRLGHVLPFNNVVRRILPLGTFGQNVQIETENFETGEWKTFTLSVNQSVEIEISD